MEKQVYLRKCKARDLHLLEYIPRQHEVGIGSVTQATSKRGYELLVHQLHAPVHDLLQRPSLARAMF